MNFVVVESLIPSSNHWFIFRENTLGDPTEILVEFSNDKIIATSRQLTEQESIAVRAARKKKKDEFKEDVERRIRNYQSNQDAGENNRRGNGGEIRYVQSNYVQEAPNSEMESDGNCFNPIIVKNG